MVTEVEQRRQSGYELWSAIRVYVVEYYRSAAVQSENSKRSHAIAEETAPLRLMTITEPFTSKLLKSSLKEKFTQLQCDEFS